MESKLIYIFLLFNIHAITSIYTSPLFAELKHIPHTQLSNKQYLPQKKIRMGLNLRELGKQQSSPASWKILKKAEHILRFSLAKANHFFIEDFHFVTRTRSWYKKSQNVTINVDIFKRIDKNNKIEEPIGEITVRGKLLESQSHYNFEGFSKNEITFDFGRKKLQIIAGLRKADSGSPLAKREPSEKNNKKQ